MKKTEAMRTLKKSLIIIGAIYLCLLVFDEIFIKIYGQTPSQALTIVSYSAITSQSRLDGCDPTYPCIDNRSQFVRQSSMSSYRAISNGAGSWTVDMQWADNTPTVWTSFGSTAQVANTSTSGIGFGIGPAVLQKPYHDYIRFVMSGNVMILNYSGTRQFWWLPAVASVAFPISATQGGTVGAFVVDQLYGSLAGACTAASGNGESVFLTYGWSGLTSQSLACNIQAFSGGSIKPASGQTVTITGAFDGDLTKHFDNSAGSSAVVNLSGPTTVIHPEWWGAKADFVLPSTVNTDSCTPIGYALTQGRIVQLSHGIYYTSCSLQTTLASTTIAGLGNGDIDCTTASTCLVFAAGISGLTSGASAYAWTVRDLTLYSLSMGASAGKNGIAPGTGPVYISRVTVVGFPGRGFSGSSVNVNNSQFDNDFFYGNFGDGWYCSSSDCNHMVISLIRTLNNGGIGVNLANGATDTFIAPDSEGNTGGQYVFNGTSNTVINPYCEGGESLIIAGTWTTVYTPIFGGCTITNTGGSSNLVQQGPRFGLPSGPGMLFVPNASGGVVQGVNSSNTVLNSCGLGDSSDPCGISGPFYTTGATVVNYHSPNYIATETGSNNAIAGALVDGAGNPVTLADNLRISVKLAHTLASGTGNTFALNGGSALTISNTCNPASFSIGKAMAVNGTADLIFSNTNGVWLAFGVCP